MKRAQEDIAKIYDSKIEEVERNLRELERELSGQASVTLTAKTVEVDCDEEFERPASLRPVA